MICYPTGRGAHSRRSARASAWLPIKILAIQIRVICIRIGLMFKARC
jgi:hypothetical protein